MATPPSAQESTADPVSARVPPTEPPVDGLALALGVGVVLVAGAVPVRVIVPELWSLTVKLVVTVCVPAV
jgi:hypothetical protein